MKHINEVTSDIPIILQDCLDAEGLNDCSLIMIYKWRRRLCTEITSRG